MFSHEDATQFQFTVLNLFRSEVDNRVKITEKQSKS